MNTANIQPKVSIMIISYNQKEYIHETLTSTLEQDYQNLEVVIADDGSTDGTADIILEYAKRYPTRLIPLVGGPNLGITGNCNRALQACSGEYICIMGGDDVFLPGKIKQQVAKFQENPDATLCYHSVEIFESPSNKILTISDTNPKRQMYSAADIIQNGGIPGASSVMVRRNAIPESGFDVRLPTVSDWLFFIEAAIPGRVIKLDGVHGRYRKHSRGASKKTLELLEETLYTLDIVMEKYPQYPQLIPYCQAGKARYLIGEAFRQIAINTALAAELAQRAMKLTPNNNSYRLFTKFCYYNNKLKIMRWTIVPFIVKMKYLLRKFA